MVRLSVNVVLFVILNLAVTVSSVRSVEKNRKV